MTGKKNQKLLDRYSRFLLAGAIGHIYTDLLRQWASGPEPPLDARQLKIARAKIACMDFDAEFRNAFFLALENPEKLHSSGLAKLIAMGIAGTDASVFQRLRYAMDHFDEFEDPDLDPDVAKLRALVRDPRFKGHKWMIEPLAKQIGYPPRGNLEVLRRKATRNGVPMQRGRPRKDYQPCRPLL